ncbi:transcriptional regulator ATRX-like [Hyalella azteca]|uniref:Transcriptional regulator ATRX-like n=1 Tax=Hyalella azteca TaxID=294128 RepID=A0A979FPE2_HYAAZ|nr:transcriptional regulator ATRX-like [Hyalella azteca]
MNNAVIPSLTQYPVTDEPDLNSTSVNRNKKFPFQDLDSVCTGELAHKDASDLDLCDPQSDENRVGHAQVNLTKIEEAAGVEGDLLISNPVDRLHAVIPDLRKLTSSTASTALEENDEVENKNKCVPGRTLESVADAPEISSAFCGESRDDESIPEEVSKDSKRWAKFTQIDKKASNKTLPYKLSVDSKTSPLRGVENSRPRTRLRMLRLGTVGGAAKLKSPIKSPRSRMIRNFLDSGKRLTSSSGMRRLVTTRGGLLVEKSSQLFNSSANSKFSPRKSSSDTYEDFSKRREERLRDVRICRSGNPTPRESVQSIKVSPSKRSTQECASSTERIVIKMKLLSPNLKDQNSNASETPSCITTAPTKGSTSSEWTIDRDVRTNALVSLPKFSPSSGKWKSETVKEGELKMKLKQEKPDSDVYNFDEREGEKFPLDNTSYTSCGRSIDPEGKENSVGFRNKVCYSNVTDSESEHASRRSSADSCSGNSAVDSRRSSQCSDTSDASEATDVSSCASSQTSLVSSGSEKGVQIVFKKLQDSEGYSCFRTKKKRLDFGVQKIPEVVEEEQLEPRTKSSEETKMVETPLDKLESPDNEPPVSKSPLSVILPSSLLDGEKKSGQLEDISPESVDLLTTSVPGVGTKMDVKHPHDIVEELLNSSSPSNSPYQEASNCQVHVETSKVKESVRASMECSDGRITKEFESSNLLSVKCEQEKEKKPGTDGSCRPKRRAALVSQEKSMLALSKLETKSSSKIFETRAVDAAEVIVEACQEVEPVVERCRRRPRSRNLDLLHLRTNVTASYKREASVSPDKIDSKRKKLRESLTLSLKCPSDKTGNDGTNTISPTAKISASLTIDGDEANEAGSKTSSLIVEEQSTKLVNVIEHEKCGSNQDPKVTASHEDSTLHVNPSTSLTVLSLPTSCDVSSSPNLVAPDLTDEKELVSTCPGNTGESLYNETVIECCVSLSNVFYDCKLNILSCPGCSKSITPKGIVVDTAAHMMHILCFSCDWLVVRKLSSIEV